MAAQLAAKSSVKPDNLPQSGVCVYVVHGLLPSIPGAVVRNLDTACNICDMRRPFRCCVSAKDLPEGEGRP